MKTPVLLLLCALAAVPAYSQVDRATVSGTITDSSGAVISGVKASIESKATGYKREVVSGGAGVYQAPALPVGSYSITFSKEGFQTRKFDDVDVQVGQSRTLDATLAVGTASAEVTVVGQSAPIQQNNAEVGLVIDQSQINAIPLNGRNWTALLALAPGATNTGDGTQNSVRFNGRGRDDNNFTLDGVDATGVKDPRQEANLRLNISLDAISEFRVSSGLYNAESGNGSGAQMNLVSKSGTNSFRGGLFEYFRNDRLDARQPISATGKPAFRLNQFGGNLGGRIIRDRTFFFLNYEQIEQRLGVPLNGSVPSALYKSQVLAASPSLKPLLDAYTPGNVRTPDTLIDQLFTVASRPVRENSGLFKIDHRFSDKTSAFLRYNLDDGVDNEPRTALLETRTSNFRTQNAVLQLQHVITPSLLSETRLGVNRSALLRQTNGNFSEGVNIAGFIGLQPNRTEVEIGTSFGLIENISWFKGRHIFKFGGEARKIDLSLSDTGAVTTAYASRPNFILNRADSISFASALPGVKGLRPYYFGYVQDEAKLMKTLTLSIGTRYEYYSVASTADGRGRVVDLQRCGGFCAPGTPWYFPDKNNWAPRVGLAWAPARMANKTIFRMGYGIFYGPGQIDDVNAALDSIPENFSLTRTDQPALAYPAVQFVSQARSTGISARALQRDRKDGYSQTWTFSWQQQLPFHFVGQAAYVGGNGHQLFGRSFINTLNPVTRTRPYPTFSNIDIKTNANNSSFQSLQLTLLRSAGGLTWQTQYMWSHNINDNAAAGDGNNNMISNCRQCDRGDAPWDVRHTVTANAVYQLPYGAGQKFSSSNKIMNGILGGWSLSGLFTARTGLPFDVTINRAVTDLPDGVATTPGRAAPAQRPNFNPGVPLYVASPSANLWLNPAAFSAPASLTWGNLPRSALRGPGLWQMDFTVAKNFKVWERFNLEYRAEMFNIFNRAQYGAPNANFSNLGTFGRITNVVNTSPVGAGTPRNIQMALRLRF